MSYKSARVTIKDVAATAGVSCATVSRAFSGSTEIGPETGKRIREIAKKMGYTPNSVARSMIAGKTETIGLCVPSLTDSFVARWAEAVVKKAAERGYSVMISVPDNTAEEKEKVMETFISRQVDGVIILFPGTAPDEVLLEASSDMPAVTLFRDRLSETRFPEECAPEAVEKLLADILSPVLIQRKKMR